MEPRSAQEVYDALKELADFNLTSEDKAELKDIALRLFNIWKRHKSTVQGRGPIEAKRHVVNP